MIVTLQGPTYKTGTPTTSANRIPSSHSTSIITSSSSSSPKETKSLLNIGLPLPQDIADALVTRGMTFEVHGVHYSCHLVPVGVSKDIIDRKRQALQYHKQYLDRYFPRKMEIDRLAARSATRKLWMSLLYLFTQRLVGYSTVTYCTLSFHPPLSFSLIV
jgi:hypothetical protein